MTSTPIRYEFERAANLLEWVEDSIRSLTGGGELFFSNGSWADNYLACSALSMRTQKFRLIIDNKYLELARSFDLGERLAPANAAAMSRLGHFFTFNSDWMRRTGYIKPILGVYYPFIPDLINHYRLLDHFDFIKAVCGVPLSTHVGRQTTLSDRGLTDLLSSKIAESRGYISIFPETNTLLNLDPNEWMRIIDSARTFASKRNLKVFVVLNPSSDLRSIADHEDIIFPTPHLLIPFVAGSDYMISNMSGACHISRIFTDTKIIGIANYKNFPYVISNNPSLRFDVDFQHRVYQKYYRSPFRLVKFRGEEDAPKVLDILESDYFIKGVDDASFSD